MSNFAIQAEGISKLYMLGERERYGSLREALSASFSRRRRSAKGTEESFWALRDVSFDVKRGEVVGIIGGNGAGKSTLLKILSRITEPTRGEARVHGRMASLLEVGTGFHAELSGRDNIFLNGAILGMKQAEIRRKFDEIVAFAGVEKFIDTPVKRYSSGMYVRLAFAVAAHLEPEILVIDEVLAVGDVAFQQKCLGKLGDVARDGRTVLFVTHNMLAVKTLCSRVVVLGHGRVIVDTPEVSQAIGTYCGLNTEQTDVWERDSARVTGESPLIFTRLSQSLLGGQPSHQLRITAELRSLQPHPPAFLAVDILDATAVPLLQALPKHVPFIAYSETPQRVTVNVDLPPLVPGTYQVTLWVGSHYTTTFDLVPTALTFVITDTPQAGRTFPHTMDHGFLVPESNAVVETEFIEA